MKKWLPILAATAALAATGVSFAGAPEMAPTPSFDGFYVGGEGGAVAGTFGLNGFNLTTNYGHWATGADITGSLGLDAGWGMVFKDRWYAGLELEANFFNVRGHSSWDIAASQRRYSDGSVENSFGGYARLGFLFDPNVLMFVMGGYAFSTLEYNGGMINPSTHMIMSSFHRSEHAGGPSFGVGVQTQVSKNIDLRFVYKFTFYTCGIHQFNNSSATYAGAMGSPFVQQALFGIDWHFMNGNNGDDNGNGLGEGHSVGDGHNHGAKAKAKAKS